MSHTPAHEELKEQAALYALGALETAEARDFERHLAEGCEACAAELREFEGVAARLALASTPATPPAGAREKLLSHIAAAADTEDPRRPERSPADASAPGGRSLAADLLVVRRDAGEWAETSDRGVFVKTLFVDREHDTVTRLVRLDPGARIRPHRHLGYEQCLVVEGVMRAGELHLRAGDFNCAAPGTIHEEIYTEEGALLLIVAPEKYEVLGGRREHGLNG